MRHENANFVLVASDRIAVLAARSAAKDTGNQPRSSAGVSRGEVPGWLERELGADFDESPAHDLNCVPPLIIRRVVPCLLVENSVFVEHVVDVQVPLDRRLSSEWEESTEPEIE